MKAESAVDPRSISRRRNCWGDMARNAGLIALPVLLSACSKYAVWQTPTPTYSNVKLGQARVITVDGEQVEFRKVVVRPDSVIGERFYRRTRDDQIRRAYARDEVARIEVRGGLNAAGIILSLMALGGLLFLYSQIEIM